MSQVWQEHRENQWLWGAIGSVILHGLLGGFLFLMPAEARDKLLGAVDFSVNRTERAVEPEKEPPVEEKIESVVEEVPVKAARPRAKVEKIPEVPPEPPPKPPPKFTMSGGTFADEGTWGLAADVGDSRFGAIDGEGKYTPGDDEKKDQKAVTPAPVAPAKPKKPKAKLAKSSEVKTKPKVKLEQTIPYPTEARKLGIEGKVRMRVDIDEQGKVIQVTVLEEPGGGLGKAAAKALEGFLFEPAVDMDGNPVAYRITYIYVFELE